MLLFRNCFLNADSGATWCFRIFFHLEVLVTIWSEDGGGHTLRLAYSLGVRQGIMLQAFHGFKS